MAPVNIPESAVVGEKAFTPDCSFPPSGTEYVSSPAVRGTLSIIWSCFSILILCTWSVQHLSVPIQARPATKVQSIRRRFYFMTRKLKWMGLLLLAPEYSMGMAAGDLYAAYRIYKDMKPYAMADDVEWTLTHSFFANIGGFAIQFPSEDDSNDPDRHSRKDTSDHSLSSSTTLVSSDVETTSEPDASSQKTFRTESYNSSASGGPSSVEDCGTQAQEPKNPWSLSIDSSTSQDIIASPSAAPSSTMAHKLSRKYLNKRWCLDVCKQLNERDCKAMGPNGWRVSRKNKDLVQVATGNVSETIIMDPQPRLRRDCYENIVILQGNIWILDAMQLLYAREQGIISRLPNICKDEIEDQSNGDILVKGLAVIQVLWLVCQLIDRAYSHLPATQLEILALSFSASAFITYLLLLKKPQDVATLRYISAARFPNLQEITHIASIAPETHGQYRTRPWMPTNVFHRYHQDTDPFPLYMHAGLLGGILFGSLHCLAWDFTFPTRTERVLWIVSALLSIGAPILVWLLAGIIMGMGRRPCTRSMWIVLPVMGGLSALLVVSIMVYVFARLFIMVEAFRSLCFLPPAAFVATWTANVPHIG